MHVVIKNLDIYLYHSLLFPELSNQLLNLPRIAARAYLHSSKFLSSRGENMNDRFVDRRSLYTCKMFVLSYESCKSLQGHYTAALY